LRLLKIVSIRGVSLTKVKWWAELAAALVAIAAFTLKLFGLW
jgi:hypothetical protein